ncbi:monovalent cation/H(+) antiporter subunit G [Roseospira navarrensis]|uniref:Sodium:proton antiporter n=1 Tax=Roseospira navarrensis TaxID=140058 RepID=A0A7X2D4W6_9PROT|nr:monovalent cation/H(+) antiporter subunit G [Roseospira navarrensis]MQX38348.1 sodium:proton antiporter [Roseospira navarrensis]
MDAILIGLSWVLIVAGGVFSVLSGLGVVRFPDVFTRMHAASLADTLGAGLIILGLLVQAGIGADLVGIKLILILVFLLFTSPVVTHALAQAALRDGLTPWTRDGTPTEAGLDSTVEEDEALAPDALRKTSGEGT